MLIFRYLSSFSALFLEVMAGQLEIRFGARQIVKVSRAYLSVSKNASSVEDRL